MGKLRTTQNWMMMGVLFLLSACAGQKGLEGQTQTRTETGSPATTTSVRHCTDNEILDTSSSLLAGFFSTVVSQLEGPPTVCYEFNGTGSDIDANIMIEYEDRFGIRSVKLDDQYEVASFQEVDENGSHIEVIWRDAYGLVKLFGTSNDDSGIVTAEIRYYNFPSFEEALNQAIEEVRQKCQDGTMTTYECLGYTYPTFWWNQPLHTSEGEQILQMIKDIMAGGSGKYTVLGTVELELGVSTWPQQ